MTVATGPTSEPIVRESRLSPLPTCASVTFAHLCTCHSCPPVHLSPLPTSFLHASLHIAMGRQLKKKVLERPLAVVKRKHFERGCQYIARRWLVDDYAKISAKDLVRLGIYATPRDLQQYSTQEILRAIGEQVKESFLHEYLWYIHAVEGSSNLAVAVYGMHFSSTVSSSDFL